MRSDFLGLRPFCRAVRRGSVTGVPLEGAALNADTRATRQSAPLLRCHHHNHPPFLLPIVWYSACRALRSVLGIQGLRNTAATAALCTARFAYHVFSNVVVSPGSSCTPKVFNAIDTKLY